MANSNGIRKVDSIWLMKNATGGPLTFQKYYNFRGQIGEIPYPKEIPTGKWAKFVHSGDSKDPSGSVGVVIYRFKNNAGKELDWVISWDNEYGEKRKVHCVIVEASDQKKDTVLLGIKSGLNCAAKYSKAHFEGSSAEVYEVRNDPCDVYAIFQGIIDTK